MSAGRLSVLFFDFGHTNAHADAVSTGIPRVRNICVRRERNFEPVAVFANEFDKLTRCRLDTDFRFQGPGAKLGAPQAAFAHVTEPLTRWAGIQADNKSNAAEYSRHTRPVKAKVPQSHV